MPPRLPRKLSEHFIGESKGGLELTRLAQRSYVVEPLRQRRNLLPYVWWVAGRRLCHLHSNLGCCIASPTIGLLLVYRPLRYTAHPPCRRAQIPYSEDSRGYKTVEARDRAHFIEDARETHRGPE